MRSTTGDIVAVEAKSIAGAKHTENDMTPEKTAQAAMELVAARRSAKAIVAISEGCRPETAADGYAVQKAFMTAWDEPVAGWKAGATIKAVQDRFGLGEPFLGPMFAPAVTESPATLRADVCNIGPAAADGKRMVSVEVEFAFRLGRALAPRAGGYSESDVLEAVDVMIPAVEIITPRFEAVPGGTPGQALADCGLNGGIVLGTPVKEWRDIDYPSFATKLVVDGKTVVEGTGELVLGSPLKSLVWLVNAVAQQGHTLAAGQILTTGSMTGIYQVPQGSEAVGDFGTLGKVTVRFV